MLSGQAVEQVRLMTDMDQVQRMANRPCAT